MPIPVTCQCGLNMEAPDNMAGQAGQCPQCNQQFVVPKPVSAAAMEADAMASLLDEVGVQKARSRHSCPECRADVKDDAVICVSCGLNLETGKRVKQKVYSEVEKEKPHSGKRPSKPGEPTRQEEDLGVGLKILSFLIPIAGLIIYFTKKSSEPHKAKQAINLAAIGVLINIVLLVVRALMTRGA